MMPFVILIIASCLAWFAKWEPKILTNHIPHLFLSKRLADKVQLWLEE